MNWQHTMLVISDLLKPAVSRYQDLAAGAAQEHLELAESMVIHDPSLYHFVELELGGEGNKSIDGIYRQITNKIAPP